jgi:putrescine aminotransferase
VGEARSVGLIGAIELVKNKQTREFFDDRGDVGTLCRDICFNNGLIMRAVEDTMVISPPLVITQTQTDELLSLVSDCLDQTAEKLGL